MPISSIGLQLQYGIQPLQPVPVDFWSGPYYGNTEADALAVVNGTVSGIPPALRFQSMEVRLIIGSVSHKYWYRDGTASNQLVEFTSGSGGTTTGGTSSFYVKGTSNYSYDTTSDIYRTGAILIGTASVDTNDRFVVSSTTGTVSLVVDNNGSVYNLSKGITNSSFGYQALYSNTTGYNNSSFGIQTLQNNTTGYYNTAFGNYSLRYNTTGYYNTAFGEFSLGNNGTGVSTFTLSNSGSGFTQSTTFSNIQLSYISGSSASIYPIVDVVVGAGGTVSSVTLVTTGTGFKDITTVMGSNLGGSGTTFSITTSTIATGVQNTALGYATLYNNTTGYYNTAVGLQSLYKNTTGYLNTAVGRSSLYYNTSGYQNTAVGHSALQSNTTGFYNNAFSGGSLNSNISGSYNTAIGQSALGYNTTGSYSTALGHLTLNRSTTVVSALGTFSAGSGYVTGTYSTLLTYSSGSTALTYPTVTIVVGAGGTVSSVTLSTTLRGVGFKDTTTIMSVATSSVGGGTGSGFTVRVSTLDAGSGNTALGHQALMTNITGSSNISIGFNSMNTNSTGSQNVAIGGNALFLNTTGSANTALGFNSSYNNTTGTNTAIGWKSLYWNTTGTNNITLGYQSLFYNNTGSTNVAIGDSSLYSNTTGNQNTAIGYQSLFNNTTVVSVLGTFSAGSGYTPNTYTDIQLTWQSGSTAITYPKATIVVTGGTVSSVTLSPNILYRGAGFRDTTTIMSAVIPGGSGFRVGVSSIESGSENTAFGYQSLYTNTIGIQNVGIGSSTLQFNIFGTENTAIGYQSLRLNNGYQNTAIGHSSLYNNGNGLQNTAVGYQSLYSNSSGHYNTAIGSNSLRLNTTGYYNTAIGNSSLYSNTLGSSNTAIGLSALYYNQSGSENTAIGSGALFNNNNSDSNIAIGNSSLFSNTSGLGGVAIGRNALYYNTVSDKNTAVGYESMKYYKGDWSTAVGGAVLSNASTGIATLSATFSPGQGYTPGTYSNVRLYYNYVGSYWSAPNDLENEYPTAQIVVGAGGTISSVTLKNRGVLITSTTTRFGVTTGTYSHNLGTASGSGFSIGIATLGYATWNTALGYGAMNRLGVGSNNIAIGTWAGLYYGSAYSNYLSGADQSIFIGRYSMALYNNGINEIVIGDFARGNGSNSVTLGNDGITKTYLKGKVVIADGTQGVGKVLTSDADGVSSWATASAVGGGSGGTSSFYIKGTSTYSYDTTSDIFRTGYLNIGTGTATDGRFVVSSTTGTVSLVVDNNGNVYNKSKGITNSVFGYQALQNNTTGYFNTAIGYQALQNNTIGDNNSAFGIQSLLNNTTGYFNTAIGSNSLRLNTSGANNTAIGIESLYSNIDGSNNTAIGNNSLRLNTTSPDSLYIDNFGDGGYPEGTWNGYTLIHFSGSVFDIAPICTIFVDEYGEVTGAIITSPGSGFIDSTTIFTVDIGGNLSARIGIATLTSGFFNVAIGDSSLYSNITGKNNTAIGVYSLYFNTTGYSNTAIGVNTLFLNTTGNQNTALGLSSLYSNTTGYSNTAVGYQSLIANTTGTNNTAVGLESLYSNTTGQQNVVIGYQSLYYNKNGIRNTAIGYQALYKNINGSSNLAIGYQALYNATQSSNNTAISDYTLYSNTTGYSNIAIGNQSLRSNTTGYSNIAIGEKALYGSKSQDRNTAVGWGSMKYYNGLWSVGFGGGTLGVASTGIKTLSATFSPGNNYSPGTYSDVRLYWNGIGTYWTPGDGEDSSFPTATIVVGSGGTVSSVTLKQRGVSFTDTTTRLRTYTGTYGYQLGTASGSGFEIGIGTLGTATFNTALGYGAMYTLGIGSDNIAIGMWAGSKSGPTASNDLYESDQSIFIGRFASAKNNISVNEIVIGTEGRGNGNNTITFGNDSITRTYLKGSVVIADGTQGVGKVLTSDADGVSSWATASSTSNLQKTITTNTTLDDTYNGAIVKVKTSANITIPSDLMTNFNCVFRTFVGTTASFIAGSGTTMDAPYGMILPTYKMATLFKDGSTTTYILEGELTT